MIFYSQGKTDNPIVLRSDILVVTSLKRKTSAKMFKNVSIGDELQLTVDAEVLGSNRGKSYAIYFKVTNLTSGESTHLSPNNLKTLYDNIEFNYKLED